MAGLRTNTLVAIGAASFVIFAGLFPDEGSPTRVAAQVRSALGEDETGLIVPSVERQQHRRINPTIHATTVACCGDLVAHIATNSPHDLK